MPAENVKNIDSHLSESVKQPLKQSLYDYFKDYFTDVDMMAGTGCDICCPYISVWSRQKRRGGTAGPSMCRMLRIWFSQGAHVDFWPSAEQSIQNSLLLPHSCCSPFQPHYLCEMSFSVLTAMKNIYFSKDGEVVQQETGPLLKLMVSVVLWLPWSQGKQCWRVKKR